TANSTTFPTLVPLSGYPAVPNVVLDTNGSFANGTLFATGTGLQQDYNPTCTRVAGVNASAQGDTLCSNNYKRQINPSDTGNIRMSSLFHVTNDLTLTIDPSVQYTLANGGSQYTQLRENDPRLIGTTAVA